MHIVWHSQRDTKFYVENLIENALAEAMMEVGEGAVRRCLEEVETAKKAEPDVIAESRSKLAVSTDLAEVD